MEKFVENKETRKLQAILNLPEIRSGRIPRLMSAASLSNFKNRKTNKIKESEFLAMKEILNNLHITLSNLSKRNVKSTDLYLIEILDIAEIKFLNWEQVLRNVDLSEKPNPAILRWSYYKSGHRTEQKPNGNTIDRFKNYFEQLRYELKLLSTKVKI